MEKFIYKYHIELTIKTHFGNLVSTGRVNYRYIGEEQMQGLQEEVKLNFDSFDDFHSHKSILNATPRFTIFRKKPYIIIYDDKSLNWIRLYKKDFINAHVEMVFEKPICSISTLAKLLPSDDFIEYCANKKIPFTIGVSNTI